MAFLYAVSDIHGMLDVFQKTLSQLDMETPENRLILLGDYIDYGPESGETLRCVYRLQKKYGKRVTALRGNHEEDFLEWLRTYGRPSAGKPDRGGVPDWNEWLRTDMAQDFRTLRTLVPPERWERFRQEASALPEEALNVQAAGMVLEENRELIAWLKGLPYYVQTEEQIFVHAGVDEEAEDWWPWGTPESTFVGKFPAETGPFYLDIIAGHVGTYSLVGNPDYHKVFWDGESHYYIDGTTARSGCLPVLKYDTETGEYTQITGRKEERIGNGTKL